MIHALQVLAILLIAVAMALALAHALELPGKLRLSREHYLAIQPIYYPGFTIGGAAEPLAILATLLLLVFLPAGGGVFWLTLAALVALVAMHATYWLMTHPVNNFWLRDVALEGAGARFFAADPLRRQTAAEARGWELLRDRWEHSHVVRAVLGVASLALLASAVAR